MTPKIQTGIHLMAHKSDIVMVNKLQKNVVVIDVAIHKKEGT